MDAEEDLEELEEVEEEEEELGEGDGDGEDPTEDLDDIQVRYTTWSWETFGPELKRSGEYSAYRISWPSWLQYS